MFLSCHVCISEGIHTSCLKQVQNLNFKWLQLDSNPQPLSSHPKWLSVHLWTKWLWVKVQLQSPKLLGCFFHCILEWLCPYVPTASFRLMSLQNQVDCQCYKWNIETMKQKTQQKKTYLILYCVKLDWFYSIQISELKTIFHQWKPF